MSKSQAGPSARLSTQTPARVRLMDESRLRRFVLARALRAFGYEVTEGDCDPVSLVEDGPCDLLLIDADQAPGALCSLDDACKTARAHWPDCAIALLVADDDQWPQDRREDAGVDAALRKPVEPSALHACLEALLEKPAPEAPLLDLRVLADIERLGGRAFVAGLIEQFAGECETLPDALDLAAKARDDYAFCALLHALRSAAGNLGASRVFARCLAWRDLGALELSQDGESRVAILREDLAQTLVALRALPG